MMMGMGTAMEMMMLRLMGDDLDDGVAAYVYDVDDAVEEDDGYGYGDGDEGEGDFDYD